MSSQDRAGDPPLKILTYNVHSCVGTDRRHDPARIAEVIAASGADIIGMQELDVGRRRTGSVDQAHAIASALRMQAHFHPAMHVEEEKYGDAILTALPVRLIKADGLPSIGEPRGAIWVEVTAGDRTLQVINTHLGLWRRERLQQVAALLGPAWLAHPDCLGKPTILMGDFNSVPSSLAYRTLTLGLRDAGLPGPKPRPTFPSRYPLLRLDYIFLSGGLASRGIHLPTDPLSRRASDHLPLLATVEFTAEGHGGGTNSGS